MKTIKEQIHDINLKLDEQYAEYLIEMKRLKSQISILRSLCNHKKTTYHPDQSGNNDTCYTCDECGLEKKRFK